MVAATGRGDGGRGERGSKRSERSENSKGEERVAAWEKSSAAGGAAQP